jgi:hypothetical protein
MRPSGLWKQSGPACPPEGYTSCAQKGGQKMRMMMKVNIPVDTGNAAARSGSLGTMVQKILGDMKPEAAYFAEDGGQRTGFLFFDMKDSTELPKYSEPWFLAFNASVTCKPAMTPQDLAAALPGIEDAVRKYSKS